MTGSVDAVETPYTPWLIRSSGRASSNLRLFCLPYAGGGASVYVPWRSRRPEIDILPVKLPGRESRAHELSVEDPEELADLIVAGILPSVNEQFAIFGHSMGALLAFETAKRLEAIGHVPLRLFVSGRMAPDGVGLPDVRQMSDTEVIRYLRTIGGTPESIIDNPEVMAVYLPTIRSDLTLCHSYFRRPAPPLSCPISVYYGLSDGSGDPARYAGWRQVGSQVSLNGFPGGHFFPFAESRPAVLDLVLAQLVSDATAKTGRH